MLSVDFFHYKSELIRLKTTCSKFLFLNLYLTHPATIFPRGTDENRKFTEGSKDM